MLINTLGGAEMRLRRAAYVAPAGGGDPDAPTISNVTGTVGTGNSLTITGTKLHHVDTSDWESSLSESKAGFEGANLAADGWGGATDAYDTSIKLMGSQSHGWTASDATANPGNALYKNDASQANVARFIGFCVRHDVSVGNGSWPSNYQKIYNNYPPDPAVTVNYNFQGNSGNAFTRVVWESPDNTETGLIPGGAIKSAKWYHHCVEMPNGSPHTFRSYINNILVSEFNHSASPGHSDYDNSLDLNRAGSDASYACRTNWDFVVFSSSRIYHPSCVTISDSETFGAGNEVHQHSESISDTENVVTCDLTGLSEGQKYLFVTNGRGLTSDAYAL